LSMVNVYPLVGSYSSARRWSYSVVASPTSSSRLPDRCPQRKSARGSALISRPYHRAVNPAAKQLVVGG
jgi:hypothetical protein